MSEPVTPDDGFDAAEFVHTAERILGGVPRGGGPVGAKRRRRFRRKVDAFVAREHREAQQCIDALRSFKPASFERIVRRLAVRLPSGPSRAKYHLRNAWFLAGEAQPGSALWTRVLRGSCVIEARRHLAKSRLIMMKRRA